MKVKQKGAFVLMTRVIGTFLIFLACLFVVSSVVAPIIVFREYSISNNTDFLLLLIGSIVINFSIALGLGLSGGAFLGLFPDLHYHETGFTFSVLFYKAKVDWDEVVELIEIERMGGICALVINKRGMFFNLLHGRFLARSRKRPIIPVSPQSAGFQSFIKYLEKPLEILNKNH